MKRYAILLLSSALAACATTGEGERGIAIETVSQGRPLEKADCTVATGAGSWQVTTPGTVPVGAPNGDLRVVCHKAGYRSSEVVYRATVGPGNSGMTIGIGGGSGGGRVGLGFGFGIPVGQSPSAYPSRIVVEMNPQ